MRALRIWMSCMRRIDSAGRQRSLADVELGRLQQLGTVVSDSPVLQVAQMTLRGTIANASPKHVSPGLRRMERSSLKPRQGCVHAGLHHPPRFPMGRIVGRLAVTRRESHRPTVCAHAARGAEQAVQTVQANAARHGAGHTEGSESARPGDHRGARRARVPACVDAGRV